MTVFHTLFALIPLLSRKFRHSYITDTGESFDGFEEFSTSDTQHITFVSSNSIKIREVKLILGDSLPWELKFVNIDLEELQASPIAISQSKCRYSLIMSILFRLCSLA